MENWTAVTAHVGPPPEEVPELLRAAGLPADDLGRHAPTVVASVSIGGTIVGFAAAELYGRSALLRSVVVDRGHRREGLGTAVIRAVLRRSLREGAGDVYLLTEDAAPYFAFLGFAEISRTEAPDEIRASSEFAHVCPDTAILMRWEAS